MGNVKDTIVLVTGGFDPLHKGHIAYFDAAEKLGTITAVGVNSNEWLIRKKGKYLLDISDRIAVINHIYLVEYGFEFNDDDGTAIDAIKKVRAWWPTSHIIFANGGDRTADNIPEMSHKDDNLSFVFGVGGTEKLNSSSKILENYIKR